MMEPAFLLVYYMGFTFKEAYNLPVTYKRWFIDRISKELSKGADDGSNQSRALHQNAPTVRELQGHQRSQVPSRLRRFT